MNILKILGCATNRDVFLLATLRYKGKGGMKNYLKVLTSFKVGPFMQKYNWPPITQLKTPQFVSDQPRSLETKVHPSITNEVTWITASFCSYSDWEYASSSYAYYLTNQLTLLYCLYCPHPQNSAALYCINCTKGTKA